MEQNRPLHAEQPSDAEFFRLLFDLFPDGVVVTDLDGNLIECNEGAYKALGYSKKEFEQLDR